MGSSVEPRRIAGEEMMCVGFLSDPTQGIRNIALLFGF